MFNHKRLITLSIAASMVIPSFSTMTSVLANEPFVELNDQEDVFLETTENSEIITLTKQDFTTPNSAYFTENPNNPWYDLKSGNYRLEADVTVPFAISIPFENTVTIDLNQHTLTNENTDWVFYIGGTCIIKSGTIKHTDKKATGINSHSFHIWGGHEVSISDVSIETCDIEDIFNVASGTLNLTNSTITDCSTSAKTTGISIPYFSGTRPTVNLTKVKLNTQGAGIWQPYSSTITLDNCEIESAGLVSQIGTLNISESVIKSKSNQSATSSTLTTDQATIRLMPTKVDPLTKESAKSEISITKSEISGDIALLIADKEESHTSQQGNIKIDVLDTNLNGNYCNLGYVGNIPFTLNNVLLGDNEGNLPEKLKFVKDPQNTVLSTRLDLVKDTTPSTQVPYIISTPIKTTLNQNPATVTENSSLLTEDAQKQIEKQLTSETNDNKDTSTTSIVVYSVTEDKVTSSQENKVPLNYNYEVKLATPQFTYDEKTQQYTFHTIITATLKLDSIIGLVLPLLSSSTITPQSSEIIEKLETETTQDNKSTTTIYVPLRDVLKNPENVSSGLSTQNIQKILTGIESPDIALIDTTKLSEFEKIDLNQAFEIRDIGEVIEINGSEKQVVSNTPTSGGGSSKPKPKPQEPTEEPTTPVGTPTSMYRLYNHLTGEHLYTTNKAERDALLTSDTWKDEGQGWTAPSVSDFPVYRLLNPNTGDHHYTTDKNEFETLPSYGWIAEGIAFFSADKDKEENVILHRIYNPNAQGAGSHHYTTDKNERDTLISQGWIDEGTAWAGLPTE